MEYSHSEKNIESDYYVEHKFQQQLKSRYSVTIGSSASGIDLPSKDILTDIKVTSIKQPQSSCPYKDAKQKAPHGVLFLARLNGFEPPTPAVGGQCSIQLSYKRNYIWDYTIKKNKIQSIIM